MSQRVVVDADGHVLEPEDMWLRFLEPQWRDRAIRVAVDDEGMENLLIDGKPHMLVRGIMGMIGGIGMQDDLEALFTPGARSYQDGLVPGGYDPAADAIFNQTGIDLYFMEYDTDRAGGLAPLRLLPKGKKRVMPGFITTKTGDLENLDDMKRKFDEAAKFTDIGQLGIAPQCGFASTEEGNKVTEDDQKRKLDLVVKTAEAIWGGVDR